MAGVGRWLIAFASLLAAATVGAVIASGVLLTRQPPSQSRDSTLNEQRIVQVQQMDLATKVSVAGELTYAPLRNNTASMLSGTVTALPAVGSLIGRGQVLYELNREPVLLLYGDVPEWRTLQPGVPPGTDVAELEDNLNALGYSGGFPLPNDGVYSFAVERAFNKLMRSAGVDTTTDKIEFGRIVYFPGAVRVKDVTAPLGAVVSPGSQVLALTTTARVVEVQVPSSLGVDVMTGQTARIDADGANTALDGIVSSVRSGRASNAGQQAGTSAGTGIEQVATITFVGEHTDLPAGDVPVRVTIALQTTKGALVVPVVAVVALVEGGYALNADDGHGHYRLIPVTLGAYDDTDGLVQVAGPAVQVGLKVIAPR